MNRSNGEEKSNKNHRGRKHIAANDVKIREFFSMTCDLCSDQFETFAKAKKHYRIVHQVPGYLTCCNRRFHRRGTALNHIFYHSNPDAFRCDLCDKRFADKGALKYHIENHQQLEQRAYKCDLCPSSFTRLFKLTIHKRSQHCPEEVEKLPCDSCNKT